MDKQYKRKYRELDDDVKRRISASTMNRPKSDLHRKHISQAMVDYWSSVPSKKEHTTMAELIGKPEK